MNDSFFLTAWIAEKFSDVYSFGGCFSCFGQFSANNGTTLFSVKAYPIPFHITAWSIFFGPIIILVPLLLLLELLILVLLYLSFLSHGIYLGLSYRASHESILTCSTRPNGEPVSWPQGIFHGLTGVVIFHR